ncbi:MAG: trypsin-like peptidase domain-containing protein [Erysipelotrichaceae bacterium]|nr:trypsin-like peptidase domain-containing protein [Erysipelotrichaceae bacterium]
MKITFKNLLIIFLVALLGAASGTFGIYQLLKEDEVKEDKLVLEEVAYNDYKEGIYETAINKAIDTVVEITSSGEVTNNSFFGSYVSKQTSLGSGVIISADGYIVTNNHVVSGAKTVTVLDHSNNEYEATIIGTDSNTDLALLKIEATGLNYAGLIDSNTLNMGKEVIAIGNSLGAGISATNGIITALNREMTISNYSMNLLMTNAAVNSGNSGGGLFDLNGNLVGIVNAKTQYTSSYTTVEGTGYAIPANTVKLVVEDLKEFGFVKKRPTLGVKIITNNSAIGYEGDGLVVSEVIEGGAAYKGGLKDNDIIKAIDGVKVNTFAELSKILQKHQIGDEIELDVTRNNEDIKVKIVLSENSLSN